MRHAHDRVPQTAKSVLYCMHFYVKGFNGGLSENAKSTVLHNILYIIKILLDSDSCVKLLVNDVT